MSEENPPEPPELREEREKEELKRRLSELRHEVIDSKSRVVKSRIEPYVSNLRGIEETVEEADRRASQYEQLIPQTTYPPTSGVLGTMTQYPELIKSLESALKDNDDPLKMIMAMSMLQQLNMQMMMNQMLQLEMYDRFRERFGGKKASSDVEERIKKLEEMIVGREERDRLLRKIEKLEEEIRSVKGSGNHELDALTRKIDELKEVIKGGSMSDMINSLKDLLTFVNELQPKKSSELDEFFEKLDKYGKYFGLGGTSSKESPSATTQSSLTYVGHAPWWMHPDARQAVNDFIESIGKTIKDAVMAWVAAKKGVPSSATTSEVKSELPKELSL